MLNEKIKSLVHLTTRTWLKDSNGLFDYESKQTKNLKAFIGESISITRNGCDLNSAKIFQTNKNEETILDIIKSNDSIYQFENQIKNNMEPNENNISQLNNKIWYIINNEPLLNNQMSKSHLNNINKDYYLTQNDIIKLGRIKLIITESRINTDDSVGKVSNLENANKFNYINELNLKVDCPFELIYKAKCLGDEENEIEKNNEEKILCKICYSEEIDNINNPMVHLCNCKGGLNYAHFECIKLWMKTKLIQIENSKQTVKSYYIQGFNCEICKTPYPFKFKKQKNDKIYELIDIERPLNTNYIILESLNQIKENNNIKSIHVISLVNEEDILIGRGNMCDVRIKDISVSRFHSKLKFNLKEKTLLIKDLISKFGTLILVKSPFEIKEPIQLQIGRTYIKASIINFEDIKIFQMKKQNKKNLEPIETIQKEKIKNENKYEALETEYKNFESQDKENNNMDIEEH